MDSACAMRPPSPIAVIITDAHCAARFAESVGVGPDIMANACLADFDQRKHDRFRVLRVVEIK